MIRLLTLGSPHFCRTSIFETLSCTKTPLAKPFQLLDVTAVGSPGFTTVEKGTQDHCSVNRSFFVYSIIPWFCHSLLVSLPKDELAFKVHNEISLSRDPLLDIVLAEIAKLTGDGGSTAGF